MNEAKLFAEYVQKKDKFPVFRLTKNARIADETEFAGWYTEGDEFEMIDFSESHAKLAHAATGKVMWLEHYLCRDFFKDAYREVERGMTALVINHSQQADMSEYGGEFA